MDSSAEPCQTGNTSHRELIPHALLIVVCIYLFLLSIDMVGFASTALNEATSTRLLSSVSNPLFALFIGIIATSLVQSSSFTTALVVTLSGSSALPLSMAIPIIMGANIGTTVTNVIASMGCITRKEEFRRAYAGATVHDIFNIMSVIVLLPLEIKFHLIEKTALLITRGFEGIGGANIKSPIKLITRPITEFISETIFIDIFHLSEKFARGFTLAFGLIMLFVVLYVMVKIARSAIAGKLEVFFNQYLFRNAFTCFTVGMIFTAIVQSSSVTTSLAVPLIGAGIISVYQVYPYTLGANVGTTITAILASLAVDNPVGQTVAFSHLTFNIFGIAIFYPLRRLPISCAKALAGFVAEHRAFAVVFLLILFYVVPIVIIVLGKIL